MVQAPWARADDPAQRTLLRAVTDRVMGGASTASSRVEPVDGALAWHLTGTMSTDGGGFVQLAMDVPGAPADWSGHRALRLRIRGDGGRWFASVRTPQIRAPWQSWRAPLPVEAHWSTVTLPPSDFAPHRLSASIDWTRVTRLGLLAVGEDRPVDLAVAWIGWEDEEQVAWSALA